MNVNISINIRNKMKNHKYHTLGTRPKYHTLGTRPKYHTLGTRPKSYQEIVEKGKNKVKVF
jgi:hypothetical protein